MYKEPHGIQLHIRASLRFRRVNFLEPRFFGDRIPERRAALEWRSQATFQNPFPASNPLVPIAGRAFRRKCRPWRIPPLVVPKGFPKSYKPPEFFLCSANCRRIRGIVYLLRELWK